MSARTISFAMSLVAAAIAAIAGSNARAQEQGAPAGAPAVSLPAEAPAAVVPTEAPRKMVEFAVTTGDIADVRIIEESPGRFIADIQLTAARKKAFATLTSAHVGEDVQVAIAGEPVLRTEIRGPIDAILIGPWMNEGLANLFARCVVKCGPKKCL